MSTEIWKFQNLLLNILFKVTIKVLLLNILLLFKVTIKVLLLR